MRYGRRCQSLRSSAQSVGSSAVTSAKQPAAVRIKAAATNDLSASGRDQSVCWRGQQFRRFRTAKVMPPKASAALDILGSRQDPRRALMSKVFQTIPNSRRFSLGKSSGSRKTQVISRLWCFEGPCYRCALGSPTCRGDPPDRKHPAPNSILLSR